MKSPIRFFSFQFPTMTQSTEGFVNGPVVIADIYAWVE